MAIWPLRGLFVVTPAQHLPPCLALEAAANRSPLLEGIEDSTGSEHEVAAEAQPDSPFRRCRTHFLVTSRGGAADRVTRPSRIGLGEQLMARIARPFFRTIFRTTSRRRVGGAVKNVLAIACGVVEGRRLGLNARAALISRGFAEMTRFGLAKGARIETLAGLAGLGDLVLTCSSTSSRNFSLGKGIGEGARPSELLADRKTVAEGAFTAPVLKRAAAALGVDMPIVDAVCALLAEEASVDEVVERLLARPLRAEGV